MCVAVSESGVLFDFVVVAVHPRVDEGFLGDEILVEETLQVVVPLDVSCTADDIFE